ncbi:MAG: TIGR02281 family clan AA aspartic protease [Pseudomonadota bacterium]
MRDSHDDLDGLERLEHEGSNGLLSALLSKTAPLLLVCGAAAIVMSALSEDASQQSGAPTQTASNHVEALVPSQSTGNTGGEPYGEQATTSELFIRANALGHFLVDTEVNGEPVRFLVDTGATKVALAAKDAQRLGLTVDRLRFTEVYKTANGEVHAAPVTLRQIRIGQFVLRDVEAIVTNSPMNVSLLGMSYLGRLQSYEVRDNKMVMAW